MERQEAQNLPCPARHGSRSRLTGKTLYTLRHASCPIMEEAWEPSSWTMKLVTALRTGSERKSTGIGTFMDTARNGASSLRYSPPIAAVESLQFPPSSENDRTARTRGKLMIE